ncbi:MAG: bifunctional aspartate kinase/homoserine dehydrogenase I, partial [Muribaculaceae bacterium]|nr:bifunctional aspartate kinase/homoserine dehydrogenase I [Muribaculaceae bacterium]
MKVLKFGGTSVGSVESLRNVKSIVESIDDHAVVIVSALGGLTDQLIATAKSAAANDLSYLDSMKAITARHINIIENVVAKDLQKEVNDKVSALLSDLERLYAGVYP